MTHSSLHVAFFRCRILPLINRAQENLIFFLLVTAGKVAKMDLLQIAGYRHESQVRIIQRDSSRANSVSGIPKNCKTPWMGSVFGGFEFRALLFRELGATISHRPQLCATRFIAHETGSTRMEGGSKLKVNAGRVGRGTRGRQK